MQEKIIHNVLERKLIAIVRGGDPSKITDLGKALLAGGINMIEVTFDQRSSDGFKATTDSIRTLCEQFAGEVLVGAGTVLSTEQVDLARAAGAGYIITPSTDCDVIRYAKSLGLVVMPGAMTPSEIFDAYRAGADFVKVFPAGDLGPGYIKAVSAPLSHIPLLAVGGINEKNVKDFLAVGVKGFGVGGNLVNKAWIREGRWDLITGLAAEFVKNVQM